MRRAIDYTYIWHHYFVLGETPFTKGKLTS
jgi:hypothetical protein